MVRRWLAMMLAVVLLMALAGTPADAAVGPRRLQRLAQAQTALLLSNYVEGQLTSPASCEPARQLRWHGVTLLPSLSFAAGDRTLACELRSPKVLLDLGGIVVSEDATGDTYTTAGGLELTFDRRNLEAICDDLLPLYAPSPGPATVDGKPITTGTAVSTAPVVARVGPDSGHFYSDSVALGHPGRLAASYCGWKTELKLRRGYHEIVVDLSGIAGKPTTVTYQLWVGPHR
jgi:hypothetical protein